MCGVNGTTGSLLWPHGVFKKILNFVFVAPIYLGSKVGSFHFIYEKRVTSKNIKNILFVLFSGLVKK